MVGEMLKIISLTTNDDKIASLLINDYMGGKILYFNNHYFNQVNNKIINLYGEQKEGIEINRNVILTSSDTNQKYLNIVNEVKCNFNKYGTHIYCLTNENNKKFDSKIPGTLGGYSRDKIYGKLDCRSALRWIAKGQYILYRVFFENEETAIAAGYRPCSICMHEKYLKWKLNYK